METPRLQPGQLIEETYRIIRRIGEGGMGEVYEATHARLAGRYALKLLLREIASDPGLLARFEREAQITSSLRHPNIVQVVDFRRLPDGVSFMVMEFLDGVDLAVALKRTGAFPVARAVAIVDQVASGLAAAHEQGIVHRDLKPQNLFLIALPGSGRELVKIVDFGISKVRESGARLTKTATVMGTPQYMAPEQALGQLDRIDARSDQFSLACIAYELLAGRPPFWAETIPALMYQLVHADPHPLLVDGRRASALEAVLRRGLSKEKEQRYPNVLDLAEAFAAAAREALPDVGGATTFEAGKTLLLPTNGEAAARVERDGPTGAGAGSTTFGAMTGESLRASRGTEPNRRGRRLALLGAGAAVAAALTGAALLLPSQDQKDQRPTAAAKTPVDPPASSAASVLPPPPEVPMKPPEVPPAKPAVDERPVDAAPAPTSPAPAHVAHGGKKAHETHGATTPPKSGAGVHDKKPPKNKSGAIIDL